MPSLTARDGKILARIRYVKRNRNEAMRLTMLDLISLLQAQQGRRMTEEELTDAVLALINSGRVKLAGNYAKAPLPLK